MKRIDTENREIDKFGPGKDGFRSAVPGVSEPTYLSASFFNAIQESLVRVIEQAGFIPSDDYDQFANVIALGGVYKALGVGAISRPAQEKLRERPSLADYASAQQAIDENDALFVPPGAFDLSDLPANPYGKPIQGPGALMTPVDHSDPTKGLYRYIFPEVDAGQRTFGEEYLFGLHKHWKDQLNLFPGTLPDIYICSDSTGRGDYIEEEDLLPHNALKFFLRQNGFDANIINRSVSGAVVSGFNMTDTEIGSAKGIIISYGINHLDGIEKFVADYRAVLARIRSKRNYLQCSVIIKTSNACGATQDGRDETQAHAQRQALRQAARDYNCFFFDTAAYFADARSGASGIWDDSPSPAPSIRLLKGHMDDYRRTDPNYHDPHGFGCTVHPLEIGNMWIWGRLALDITRGARFAHNNNFFNIQDATLLASAQANTAFKRGLHVQRATIENGFPVDGEVITFAAADGTGLQFNYGIDVPPTLSFRTVKLLDGAQAWGEWSPVGTQRATLAPPINGWIPFTAGQNTRVAKGGTAVTISGALKGGTFIAGTTLFMLPPGFRPPGPCWFTVPCGVNMDQMASIVVLADGVVAINNCPTNAGLSLGGITFEVAS